MNGIHDMGGMHGFGPVVVEADEPVFHATWQQRVLGMVYQVVGFGWVNIDAFRHGIERMDPVAYLDDGYYGRWLSSLERVLRDANVLAAGELDARIAGQPAPAPTVPRHGLPHPTAGFVRTVAATPRFATGDAVRARNVHVAGHTRLPRYVRGKRGVGQRVHPAFVFPDTNAHGAGERPQYLYTVRFATDELWGPDAEPGTVLHVDLFEPYLEPA
jgi:nitrile hydratase